MTIIHDCDLPGNRECIAAKGEHCFSNPDNDWNRCPHLRNVKATTGEDETLSALRKELEGAILDKHRFADECEGLKIEVMALTEIVEFKDERLAENLAAVKKLEDELDEERTVNSAFRREIDRLKTENEILMEELSNGESDS